MRSPWVKAVLFCALHWYGDSGSFLSTAFGYGTDLQRLTGLQCMSIGISYSNFSSNHAQLPASILDKLPSSTLTKVHFTIQPPPPSPRIGELHQIGEILQKRRFSQLTELVFTMVGPSWRQPLFGPAEWIREDLCVLEERGILSIRRIIMG